MEKGISASVFHQKIDLLSKESYYEVSNYLDAILTQQKITSTDLNDEIQTHLTSEHVLAKDWFLEEEEEIWKAL